MKTADFSFDLPESLIAQHPPEERGRSRLMLLDRKAHSRGHHTMEDLPALLEEGSLLVFNNSRVRKARLLGISQRTAARGEFLLVKKRDDRTWEALVQRSKRRRSGDRYIFAQGSAGEAAGEIGEAAGEGAFRLLRFDRPLGEDWFETYGHIPLPPYIRREDAAEDEERYQTVYAREAGSAAAPTAGLHFTPRLLEALGERHIETAFITLHVGLGTFLPVRAENLEDHVMHGETYTIGPEAAAAVEGAKAAGRPVIAVGTTSLRTLEAAWEASPAAGSLRRGTGTTSIFIYPGYRFRAVDALFTNFHTPRSTLLMLASAFAGRDFILESYGEAVRESYRFFSYGDAMLIL